MPYWDVLTRSFFIAWNRRYLWLIALFSGEAGGFSFSYSQASSNNRPENIATMQAQATTWINDHASLLVGLAALSIVVWVALFILSAICEGATVRASAEHDAERPFGLRSAWTMGLHTMWPIVRFRLLLFVLYLPIWILLIAWLAWLLATLIREDASAIAGLIGTFFFLFLLTIVYGIYLFFIDRFGTRAVVLEEHKAIPGIVRANRLLFKRFGRSLVVLLLAAGVAIAIAVVLGCFAAIVGLPVLIALSAAAASGSGAFWVILVIAIIVSIPIYVVVDGFLGAQGSTYWTLAYRRLDVDYAPAYGYQAMPPASPPPAPAT